MAAKERKKLLKWENKEIKMKKIKWTYKETERRRVRQANKNIKNISTLTFTGYVKSSSSK